MKECCVGLRGLEPRASSLSGTRSNRLSYNPMTCENRSGNNPTVPSGRVAPWYRNLTAPAMLPHVAAEALFGFLEGDLHAADQSRGQVVYHGADRRHRSDQHDVERAEQGGVAKHP